MEGGQAGAAPSNRRKRVGVIGTFVWDIIYGRDFPGRAIEEWGGITYALSAFDAALPEDWEVVPIIKVGSDLARRANDFLSGLRRIAPDARAIEVSAPNNRVELRYLSTERRTEQLSGGVPAWTWVGLAPLIRDLDALYVNFISGLEFDLPVMQLLRQYYRGPIYCDLHSLLLAVEPDGLRTPRPLTHVAEWCRCADLLQVNEDEMRLLSGDPMALAATALEAGVRCLTVTLGSRGVVYFAPSDFDRLSDLRPAAGALGGSESRGTIRTALIPAAPPPTAVGESGDPTGCGDVYGATYFSRLLAGDNLAEAIRVAVVAAARNVGHRGATGLAHHLRGELSPR